MNLTRLAITQVVRIAPSAARTTLPLLPPALSAFTKGVLRQPLTEAERIQFRSILSACRRKSGTASDLGKPGDHLELTWSDGTIDRVGTAIAGRRQKRLTARDLSESGERTERFGEHPLVPAAPGVYGFHQHFQLGGDVIQEESDSYGHNPSGPTHRLGHLLRTAMAAGGLQVITDREAHRDWRASLIKGMRGFRLPSGDSFGDSVVWLQEFDTRTAARRLRGSANKWPKPHEPHLLVCGIVDRHHGRTVEIHGCEIQCLEIRDEALRSGRDGTGGPYLMIATVTLDSRNPAVACIRHAYLQPIVSRTCVALVDSDHERRCCLTAIRRDLSQGLDITIEKLLFSVLVGVDHVQPDLRIGGTKVTLLVEIIGSDDEVYLRRKNEQKRVASRNGERLEWIEAVGARDAALAKRLQALIDCVT